MQDAIALFFQFHPSCLLRGQIEKDDKNNLSIYLSLTWKEPLFWNEQYLPWNMVVLLPRLRFCELPLKSCYHNIHSCPFPCQDKAWHFGGSNQVQFNCRKLSFVMQHLADLTHWRHRGSICVFLMRQLRLIIVRWRHWYQHAPVWLKIHGFLVTRWNILNARRGVLRKPERLVYGRLNVWVSKIIIIGIWIIRVAESVPSGASSTVGCDFVQDFQLQILLGVWMSKEVTSAGLTIPLLSGVGKSGRLELEMR